MALQYSQSTSVMHDTVGPYAPSRNMNPTSHWNVKTRRISRRSVDGLTDVPRGRRV